MRKLAKEETPETAQVDCKCENPLYVSLEKTIKIGDKLYKNEPPICLRCFASQVAADTTHLTKQE